MKAIVGVDAHEAYKPALCLLARLGISSLAATLLNVVSPVMPFIPPEASDAELQADYLKVVENAGLRALDEAIDEACSRDLHARSKLVFGSPANGIMEEVIGQHADIVAVAATHHGTWSSSFLGSVSRALAIGCPASLLVAKGNTPRTKPFRVVFATDHSPFSERCLEKFISFKAKGIEEIHVVSVYSLSDTQAEVLARNLPALGGDVDRWLEEQIETKNEEVCAKLRAAGYQTTSRAVRAAPNDGIRQAMQETNAGLLIVGSHGKGFIARTFIGSVSLHQVVAEPYPVLVIRP